MYEFVWADNIFLTAGIYVCEYTVYYCWVAILSRLIF